ncbi:hypothetical protein LJB78_00510 [Bacteroidales bacterium OttesenSCG-928-J16]|nr:hypothetical protein [Bacteroidales bacterium OttesenSCG-928-J16]
MKKTLFLQITAVVLLGTFLLSSCNGTGKMAKKLNEITHTVTPEVLEAIGGEVEFKVEAKVPANFFDKKAVVVLIPEIKYPTGSKLLEPKIVVGEKESQTGYQVVSKKNGGTIIYQDKFDYLPEMEASELQVNVFIMNGKDFAKITNPNTSKTYLVLRDPDYVVETLAHGAIITSTRIQNGEMPALMNHGYEKVTRVSKSAAYHFAISSSSYSSSFGLNKAAESKAAIKELENFLNLGWKVDNIIVDGWASPDGENKFNNKLSDDRANTVKKMWDKTLSKKGLTATAKGNGQDWDGYTAAVNASSLPDKAEALAVMNYNTIEQREAAISRLVHKHPTINATILDPLRRAEIIITCFEPKFSDEELAALAISDPAKLKEPEILYAATLYPNDLDKQYTIYKNAIRQFPNSAAAHNNAGAVALTQLNDDEGAAHIYEAEKLNANAPEVQNNLGVIAIREGKIDAAVQHLNKAKVLDEGKYNSGLCEVAKGNFSAAQSLLTEKCTYGLALVQLETKKVNESIQTLDCMKNKNAEAYYLLAVANARKGDKNNMATNLKEACKMNPALKAAAQKDREFIKFFTDQAFLDAIR